MLLEYRPIHIGHRSEDVLKKDDSLCNSRKIDSCRIAPVVFAVEQTCPSQHQTIRVRDPFDHRDWVFELKHDPVSRDKLAARI